MKRRPPCPDRIVWRDQTYEVAELLQEWRRITPRITPSQVRKGLARIYFRVRLTPAEPETLYDIYFDPVKNRGAWYMCKEMIGEE